MKTNSKFKTLFILFILMLTACSKLEPPKSMLEDQLKKDHLPKYWSLSKFIVTTSENVGSKTEPIIKSRFEAKLISTEDLFKQVFQIDEHAIIEKIYDMGRQETLYGIVTSKYIAGQWNLEYKLENGSFLHEGVSISNFNKAVLKGSDKEKELFSKWEGVVAKEIERRRRLE